MSVDLAHHEIFRAKVGKGGINEYILPCFWDRLMPPGSYLTCPCKPEAASSTPGFSFESLILGPRLDES